MRLIFFILLIVIIFLALAGANHESNDNIYLFDQVKHLLPGQTYTKDNRFLCYGYYYDFHRTGNNVSYCTSNNFSNDFYRVAISVSTEEKIRSISLWPKHLRFGDVIGYLGRYDRQTNGKHFRWFYWDKAQVVVGRRDVNFFSTIIVLYLYGEYIS